MDLLCLGAGWPIPGRTTCYASTAVAACCVHQDTTSLFFLFLFCFHLWTGDFTRAREVNFTPSARERELTATRVYLRQRLRGSWKFDEPPTHIYTPYRLRCWGDVHRIFMAPEAVKYILREWSENITEEPNHLDLITGIYLTLLARAIFPFFYISYSSSLAYIRRGYLCAFACELQI